ncbi:hypothetical protein GCM10009663_54620 [Kitasatospora arboriphila]|uniref:DUF1206 domain-containing protein n=2 Tax=Kitasatospora arboriphila TaxID=258052 RepID=A0ABP4EI06_9ACTN
MDEIGRAGWLTIGVTGTALVGAGHALAGLGRIAGDMVRSPATESGEPVRDGSTLQADGGPGGWVLFSALILAGWAAHHVMSGTEAVVKEILNPAGH